jgi:hypothetical protein
MYMYSKVYNIAGSHIADRFLYDMLLLCALYLIADPQLHHSNDDSNSAVSTSS